MKRPTSRKLPAKTAHSGNKSNVNGRERLGQASRTKKINEVETYSWIGGHKQATLLGKEAKPRGQTTLIATKKPVQRDANIEKTRENLKQAAAKEGQTRLKPPKPAPVSKSSLSRIDRLRSLGVDV